MTKAGYLVLTTVTLIAAAVILWDRWRLRRTLQGLERMLDEAIRGGFAEKHFDESRLSAVETKLAHFLSASTISAQTAAEEKDKIKTLIGDISHQTKTPIANVLLYAQLLEEQDLTAEGRSCAAALEEQAQKLQQLVEALVKTSRLEAGVLALHPTSGPLAPMLEEAAAQFTPKAAEKGISLTLLPTAATADFDAKWTGEAVCNLLDNAIKYTPAGGTVTVETISYELFCRIDVTDTGPGIPEGEQAKLFGRFYRSAAVSQEPGVGIGLYLVRRIAQGQGGYIKVSSKLGRGAKFSLYLPRAGTLSTP